MMAIKRSNCFHKSGRKNPCHINSNSFMIAFSIVEIIFSEIPDFDRFGWLSIVAAVMSFTYSTIGLSLAIAKVAETGKIRGSLTGISIGTGSRTQKIWRSFQALGDIAFAYSYSLFLFEIQDTLRSPPSESKTIEEVIYANGAIVIDLVGAYQVHCKPHFAFIEKQAAERFPNSEIITKEIKIPIPDFTLAI
ncbi:hypothetical protein SLA2020_299260 [Shorea laevis]